MDKILQHFIQHLAFILFEIVFPFNLSVFLMCDHVNYILKIVTENAPPPLSYVVQ